MVRSSWLHDSECANGASAPSTNAAPSSGSDIVDSATRNARHTSTSPSSTRRHSRGSRYLVSNAWPTNRRPAGSDLPRVVISSTTATSDTAGAPSPASSSSPSP